MLIYPISSEDHQIDKSKMGYSFGLSLTNFVLLGASVFTAKKLFNLCKRWKVNRMVNKWNKISMTNDKVIFHSMWRCKTLPSMSPYGLKLETYLRMAKIPYELESKDAMGPKGKLPWITYKGNSVADSHLCIQYLNKKFSVDLNQNSTHEQLATARASRVMLENHFTWGLAQYALIDNSSKLFTVAKFPTVMKYLLPLLVRQVKGRMEGNGIGKHTPAEIYRMTEDDLRTLSILLGNKRFFGGEVPCVEDAAIFGIVAQVIWAQPESSFAKLVNGELINLKEYCERVKQIYWEDWNNILDKS